MISKANIVFTSLFAIASLSSAAWASQPWVYNQAAPGYPNRHNGQAFPTNPNAVIPAVTPFAAPYSTQSTAGVILPGGNALTNTFTLTSRTNVLVLGLGASSGGPWALGNPTLVLKKLNNGVWETIKTNSNWQTAHPQADGPVLLESLLLRVNAGGAVARGSADAAVYMQLDPGSYRAELSAAGGDGVMYVEYLEPAAVAIGGGGALFVADRDTLWSISQGSAVVVAGNGNEFSKLTGIATDAVGNFYLADAVKSVIFRVTSLGAVTIFAGESGVAGFRDGTTTEARFNGPRGLTRDSAGNLFVADTGNMAIRKIDTSGNVTTLILTEAGDNNPPQPPPPPPSGGGGGGGGGAPGLVYFTGLLALVMARLITRKGKEIRS